MQLLQKIVEIIIQLLSKIRFRAFLYRKIDLSPVEYHPTHKINRVILFSSADFTAPLQPYEKKPIGSGSPPPSITPIAEEKEPKSVNFAEQLEEVFEFEDEDKEENIEKAYLQAVKDSKNDTFFAEKEKPDTPEEKKTAGY